MTGGPTSFAAHADELTLRHGRFLALAVAVSMIVSWPLDYLHRAGEDRALLGLAAARAATVAATGGGAWILHRLRGSGRDPFLILAGVCLVSAAASGVGLTLAGGPDQAAFQAASFIPLATIPFIWPLGRRIGVTSTLVAVFFTCAFVTDPEMLGHDQVLPSLGFSVFGLILSVLVGEAMARLVRSDFESTRAASERAAELEELDQLKNEFFANVSHELRTPLTLILSSLKRLRADGDGEDGEGGGASSRREQDRMVEVGLRNAARLLVLIDELLELARFTSGRGHARRTRIDLAELVRRVALSFAGEPGSDELEVEGVDEPVTAWVDARQLRTAVYNLLSNAFKFTEPGARRVRVTLSADSDRASITVADNGVGVPEPERRRIFDRFHQVESGPARRRGGTGIGLSLVKEVAESHGGTVSLDSELGRGSTFTVEIPLVEAPADQARPAPDADGGVEEIWRMSELPPLPVTGGAGASDAAGGDPSKPRCLVAEDDPDLRELVVQALADDFRVIAAHDGAEAIARAKNEPPDVVVTDVMMPHMSGFDVARILRRTEELARVPILFLTAKVGTGGRTEAYESGADDYLTKPFDDAELVARVKNLVVLRAHERALARTNEELEEVVRDRTADLARLAKHLETSREEERRRIARELHDETGQLLTALRMELSLARKRAAGNEGLVDSLERLDVLVDEALTSTRELVQELRPRILDDYGLAAGAEWILERFAKQSELAVDWQIELGDDEVRGDAATAAFRVLQEALTNVARHARAKHVTVRLTAGDDALRLEVADDGVGVETDRPKAGFGVLGMRERAEALGGELRLGRGDAGGTRLSLRLPRGAP